MDKLRLIALYDIYGSLLTKNQKKMFELYYMCDLSLREIAKNEYVTFQAVRSALKTSENRLEEFEKVIGAYKQKERIKQLSVLLSDENINNKKIYEILDDLKNI